VLFCFLQVSLDAKVRDVINRNMVKPTRQIFDDAQLQIYTLMQRDSYPRFLASETYKRLLQWLGTLVRSSFCATKQLESRQEAAWSVSITEVCTVEASRSKRVSGVTHILGVVLEQSVDCSPIYIVSQKNQNTSILPVTSPNANRFSKFFHWWSH